MNIEILDEAQQDLLDGFQFYHRHSPWAGEYFLDSLFADIESLQLYAGIHPTFSGYKRMLAKRFPYAIYYRTEEDIVRVYAVLDCRRNPEFIRERLT